MAEEVIKRILDLQELIRGTDESILKERVYVCVANSCILLNAYITSNGEKGWSARLIDDNGQPIMDGNDQKMLEGILEKAPWVLDYFKNDNGQVGGALPKSLSDQELSLEEAIANLDKMTGDADTYWKNVSKTTFGPIHKVMKINPIITGLPPPFTIIPVSLRFVTRILITLLDYIRLSNARSGKTSIPLTLIVFLEELVTGQWRQMILTAASLFLTPSGAATTIIIKYLVMAWLMSGTDAERSKLVKNVFTGSNPVQYIKTAIRGSKSIIVNLVAWLYVVLTPVPIKHSMFGIMDAGPDDDIIDYEYVINSLSIFDSKDLICNPQLRNITQRKRKDPIFNVILELLKIPSESELDEVCNDPRVQGIQSFDEASVKLRGIKGPPYTDIDGVVSSGITQVAKTVRQGAQHGAQVVETFIENFN